jgi:alpha-ketoglutarate-dependent taurine dioxygenase
MTALAGFAVLLRHLVRRDDVVVGTDVAGRSRFESEAMIGFFVNQLALRLDLGGNPTFLEVLERSRREALEGYAHQDLPFETLVDTLKVERSLTYSPVFQVKLIMNNTPEAVTSLPGLSIRPIGVEAGTSKVDLVATLTDRPDGLRLLFNYNTDLFAAATAESMLDRFAEVLRQVAARPESTLAEIEEVLVQSQRRRRDMETTKRRESSFGKFKQVKPRTVGAAAGKLIETGFLQPGQELPLVITPAVPDLDLAEWAADNREYLDRELLKYGAILFRGFKIESPEDFESFAGSVCSGLFNENGEHPRESVNGNVYTPVFYPPDQKLLWHNENSFNLQWPGKILFCSIHPAEQGGETPIVDSRKVFDRIPAGIREKFLEKQVSYMRNYGDGLGLSWQTVFQTSDRQQAERHCQENEMEIDWKDGDRARTRMRRPAAARHPSTGEMSWFNQAQHFHVSCLDSQTRSSLLALFKEEDLPRNCYYGDGTRIEDEEMRQILDIYEELEVVFPWQKGDVVMLDNMLVAHARNPFVGKRKLLVSMGEMINSKDLS